jgi:hypothetical protein
MGPKLATLMQHLKATNARIGKNLKAEPGAASVRRIRENLAVITEMLPGHVNGAAAASC